MEILPIENPTRRGFLVGLTMEHRGQVLRQEGSIFDRTQFNALDELFMDINRFWATLPVDRQERIWQAYVGIDEAFNTITNDQRLHERLVGLVGELYSNFDFAEIRTWVRIYGGILIPPEVKERIGEFDHPERTYLREDYFGLIVLVVALRPMVPIWNRYAREAKLLYGTVAKEYMAMGLLNQTALIETPEFLRLQSYVHNNVDLSKITMSAIVGGVGSAEMPDWIFSNALIRKVAVGILIHRTPEGGVSPYTNSINIISNVYKGVESVINTLDRRFKGKIRDKGDSAGAIDDDKASNAENIIVKQELSDYAFILAGAFASHIDSIHRIIDPTIPLPLIETCIKRLAANPSFVPTDGQIGLTQWVCHRAISGRFIPSLEFVERTNVIGFTQAALWHWGYPDLALMVTAKPLQHDVVLGNNSRSRVSNDQVAALHQMYPHYPKVTNSKDRQRGENVALTAIDYLDKIFSEFTWEFNAPAELASTTTMLPYRDGGYSVPADIKVQLAQLIISKIASS